jgi:hypothetical protein
VLPAIGIGVRGARRDRGGGQSDGALEGLAERTGGEVGDSWRQLAAGCCRRLPALGPLPRSLFRSLIPSLRFQPAVTLPANMANRASLGQTHAHETIVCANQRSCSRKRRSSCLRSLD